MTGGVWGDTMATYLSWAANAVLIAIGCFVTANMANGFIAEWIAPPVIGSEASEARETTGAAPSNRSPQAIINANLFRAQIHPDAANSATPGQGEGPLEETTLPLRLLGTIASPNPKLARAALEDTDKRERLVVEVGDRIKERATVYRIEQRRIVLAENDALRELSLDDDKDDAKAGRSIRKASASRSRRRAPARPTPRERPQASIRREDVAETLRDPSKLFQQARFLPKYDGGEMQGLQVSAIKPGSILEEIGLGDGDVITEANGLAMDSPTSSGQLFREMNEADELVISVTRADGSSEELQVPIDE